MSQIRTWKRNQEFLVPALSGDKAFSSRENNVGAGERQARENKFRERRTRRASRRISLRGGFRGAALEQRANRPKYRTKVVCPASLAASSQRKKSQGKTAATEGREKEKKRKGKKRARTGEKNCAYGLRILSSARGKERSASVSISLCETRRSKRSAGIGRIGENKLNDSRVSERYRAHKETTGSISRLDAF